MSVCANRNDDPGFFTSCWEANGHVHCVCGAQLADELAEQAKADQRQGGAA